MIESLTGPITKLKLKWSAHHQLARIFGTQGLLAILSVISGKIIAVSFEPSYFGKYSLVNGFIAFLSGVLIAPTIMSFRHQYFKTDRDQLVNRYLSIFSWAILVSTAVFLCSNLFLGLTSMAFILLAAGLLFSQCLADLHGAVTNLAADHKSYNRFAVLANLGGTNFLLITALLLKISNYWIILFATLIVNGLLFLLHFNRKEGVHSFQIFPARATFQSAEFGTLLNYVKPLVFLPLLSWGVNQGDRYLIQLFLGEQEVGLYSAAYGLGSKVFLMIIGAFILYTNQSVFQNLTRAGNENGLLPAIRRKMKFYYLLGLPMVGVIWLFKDFIGKLLLSDSYAACFPLIPLLSFAYLVFTSLFILEQSAYAIGKTRFIIIHYSAGITTNILLNLLVIPRFGIMGAGWVMAASSSVQVLVLYGLFSRIRNEQQPAG